MKPNFYIITGGPGVGKTTLLDELKNRGYKCVPEVARNIIKEQMDTDGDALPWGDTKKYADLMLSRSICDFERLYESDEVYFFDRGIPDTYGYEVLMGFEISRNLLDVTKKYRYNPMAFILPPWKEIYKTDNERKQDFNIAVETYHVMYKTYEALGYTPIEVPRLSISQRADFVIDKINC